MRGSLKVICAIAMGSIILVTTGCLKGPKELVVDVRPVVPWENGKKVRPDTPVYEKRVPAADKQGSFSDTFILADDPKYSAYLVVSSYGRKVEVRVNGTLFPFVSGTKDAVQLHSAANTELKSSKNLQRLCVLQGGTNTIEIAYAPLDNVSGNPK